MMEVQYLVCVEEMKNYDEAWQLVEKSQWLVHAIWLLTLVTYNEI
jgi:hypothetical protein